MNWDTLFTMQNDLDMYISRNHQLENTALFEKKILALLVELGELANETRCFKFWSKKAPSTAQIILEEYVDNIHFLLSIGLEKNYRFKQIAPPKLESVDMTEQFNTVYKQCLQFYNDQTEQNYVDLFRQYLLLANVLGFSEEDIFKAYMEKNEVNYERQKSGY